ncbi:hypothetical protein DITRI_Ditri03aG0190000 [Diplodiscus trichospermus]
MSPREKAQTLAGKRSPDLTSHVMFSGEEESVTPAFARILLSTENFFKKENREKVEPEITIHFYHGGRQRKDVMDAHKMVMEATRVPLQHAPNDVGQELLTVARNLIDQGKPSQALQAVVMAMRTRGGDEAVFLSLYRAREVYRTRMQENTVVDQLASLFAECAIAEAQPSKAESLPCNLIHQSVASGACGTSILAETGRMQIVLDAFSDGSSFICLQCGGVVSNHRKEEHYAYWCGSM